MKINIINGDAYSSIGEIIKEWCNNNNYYTDFIVWLKANDIEIKTVYELDYDFNFIFLDDWYEGGDVELLGFAPIDEVIIPEKYTDGMIIPEKYILR